MVQKEIKITSDLILIYKLVDRKNANIYMLNLAVIYHSDVRTGI